LAISRKQKEEMVAGYVEKMSRSGALILTDYRGLSVAQITELRQNLRELDGEFQVVKNSLFERALEEAGVAIPTDQLQGPVAVGYCLGDAPPIAKALTDFAKQTEILAIKGAIIGNSILGPEGVKGLADLPPREVVLAQLLGSVQGPMSNLVGTITAPLRELVQVLQARSEQGQEAAA
jgi:large subunit ribosomal protein L10